MDGGAIVTGANHDHSDHWFRAYGHETWRFDVDGLMAACFASINEHPITETERHLR